VVSLTDPPVTGRVVRLDVDGARLAVRNWGDESGRPVFFWHPLGTVTSGAWLTELAPTLTRDFGLRLVAVDAPGFGESPAVDDEEYDVARLSRLAWAVIDAVDLRRPVLMGHSWGGVVLTHAAACRADDVAALVLLDSGHLDYADMPGTDPDLSLPDRITALEDSDEPIGRRDALHADLAKDVRRPVTDLLLAALEPAVREQADGSLQAITTPRVRAAARHGLVRERSSERWAALAAAAVPVLLLLATEPAATKLNNEAGLLRMSAALPGLDARFLTGWGHDLIGDGGPALASIIGEWIAMLP
jgi:pimeloyl-ACP methyl ester carboxylesterase